MTEEKSNIRDDQILIEIAEMLAKNIKAPIYVADSGALEILLERAKQIPQIENKYSEAELIDEVSNFMSNYSITQHHDNEGADNRINEFLCSLEKKKSYEAFIVFTNILGLPIGAKIGSLEVVEQNIEEILPSDFLRYQVENKGVYIKDRTQAKVSFSAYTTKRAAKVLDEELELPLAVLSLILDFDIDLRDCVGLIKSKDVSTQILLEPQRDVRGWVKYREDRCGEQLHSLSKISINENPTQLQNKILKGIQTCGLSRYSHKAEIKFLLLITAFESLLLTKNDKDYLGKKLSEKTAFLLENKGEERLKLYKQMKGYYNKRSKLVHEGKTQVSDSEVDHLKYIFKNLVDKLLELSENYRTMEQRSNGNKQEGVEDYINKLKFS